MRLIDADKLELKHFVQWADVVVGYNGTQPKHKHTDIIAYDISGAPTVEAIPISWLRKINVMCGQETRLQEALDLWESRKEKENG